MGLALTPAEVAALDERTEGWIAGLQLAALALRDHADVAASSRPSPAATASSSTTWSTRCSAASPTDVRDLPAAHRHPRPAVRPALRRRDRRRAATARRLLAAAGARPISSSAPLDDERRWYRYHHLFAEVLRHGCARRPAPDVPLSPPGERLVRAPGLAAEAIGHALAGGDAERAARLIERDRPQRSCVRGQTPTVLGWLRALPAELVASRPALLASSRRAHFVYTNRLAAAEDFLQAAERCIRPDTPANRVRHLRARGRAAGRLRASSPATWRAAWRRRSRRWTCCPNGGAAEGDKLVPDRPRGRPGGRGSRLSGAPGGDAGDRTPASRRRWRRPATAPQTGLGLRASDCWPGLQAMQGRLRRGGRRPTPRRRSVAPEDSRPGRQRHAAAAIGLGEVFCEANDLEAAAGAGGARVWRSSAGRLDRDAE